MALSGGFNVGASARITVLNGANLGSASAARACPSSPIATALADTKARGKTERELQVVEDAVYPGIIHLVGHQVAGVDQAQQARVRGAGQVLTQTAIGRWRASEELRELGVMAQRQHAAVVAIHRRDAPGQRQVGREYLLVLR